MPRSKRGPLQMPLDAFDAIFGVSGKMPDVYLNCAKVLLDKANQGQESAGKWAGRLHRYGATTNLIKQLLDATADYKVLTHPAYDRASKRFYMKQSFPSGEAFYDDEEYTALLVMQVVNGGLADKIKICEAPDCKNYHVRRGKWCPNDCGNRIRVRKSRAKAKMRAEK